MKIRKGFVSNSSSSSFVIVGFTGKKEELTNEFLNKLAGMVGSDKKVEDCEDKREFMWEEIGYGDYSIYEGGEDGTKEGEFIFGKEVASGENSLEYNEINIDEELKTLKEKFPDKKIKIITSTRCC